MPHILLDKIVPEDLLIWSDLWFKVGVLWLQLCSMIINLELLHLSWWNIFSSLSQLISRIEYRVAKNIYSRCSSRRGKQPGCLHRGRLCAFPGISPRRSCAGAGWDDRVVPAGCWQIWPQAAHGLRLSLFLSTALVLLESGGFLLENCVCTVSVYVVSLASEHLAECPDLRTACGREGKSRSAVCIPHVSVSVWILMAVGSLAFI